MTDVVFNLRKTAIELYSVNKSDFVKTAGVLRRIKNWWRAFNSPSYRQRLNQLKQESAKVHDLTEALGKELSDIQLAIEDADVYVYETKLNIVKSLISELSKELSEYKKDVADIEAKAPTEVIEQPMPEDTPEKEGPPRLRKDVADPKAFYTTEELKNRKVKEQLEMLLPADHDVPFGVIRKPMSEFNWFKTFSPSSDVKFTDTVLKRLLEEMANVLTRESSIYGDHDRDKGFYLSELNNVYVWRQLQAKLPSAVLNGYLLRMGHAKPSKEVQRRPTNQLDIVVLISPFSIRLDKSDVFETGKTFTFQFVLVLTDMKASYMSGKTLNGKAVSHLRLLSESAESAQKTVAWRLNEFKKFALAKSNVHQWARDVLLRAFKKEMGREPTLAELQGAQAVGWAESQYGRGWKNKGDARAVGSNNWGAVQCCKPKDGVCPPGSFLYTDTHPKPDGTSVKYQICFRAYPTPEDGAADLVKLLYKNRRRGPGLQQAAANNSLSDFSKVMYDTGYYEGWGKNKEERIANHVKYLNRSLSSITKSLKEEKALVGADKPTPQAKTTALTTKQTSAPGSALEQEYSMLIKQLFASNGPIENLVKRSVYREYFPTVNLLVKCSSENSFYHQVRFAHSLASALREILDAEVSVHSDGNSLELECDVPGTSNEKTILIAVQELSNVISKAFEIGTDKQIKVYAFNNVKSSYGILDSEMSDQCFRKFAFEKLSA